MYLLLCTALTLSPIPQDQEHPLVTAAKSSLSDTTKPFTVVIRIKVKEGHGPKFEAAIAKNVKETRKEKGNLAYELNRSAKGADYMLYERWANLAALESHLKTPHFTTTMSEVGSMIEGTTDIHLFVPVTPPAGE